MKTLIRSVVICACVLAGVLGGAADGHQQGAVDNPRIERHEPGTDLEEHSGRSVGDFLTADGQIDLEAIRSSGYQGPLDLPEHDDDTNPSTDR